MSATPCAPCFPALTARLAGELTGSHVDSTLTIDPSGAKQIVDALGGININVERDMDYDDNYGNLHIHLKKGERTESNWDPPPD